MPTVPPSLAIVNARVWTGDPRRPWADAVLVTGDRVTAVGSSAEARKRTTEATEVIDARRLLLARTPGDGDDPPVLRTGEPADLVLLRGELTPVTPRALREAHVVLEVSAGRVVRDDGAAPAPAPHGTDTP